MTYGMMFTLQLNGPVDLESIKKIFRKYFKFRVIKRLEFKISPNWTFRFDAERNEVIFGMDDVVDSEEWVLKTEAEMKHVFETLTERLPNKVKRAVILYEAEKPIVLHPDQRISSKTP